MCLSFSFVFARNCEGLLFAFLFYHRAEFENEGLTNVRERLTRLETLITAEEVNLGKLEQQKSATEQEIADSESVLTGLKTELAKLQETLEDRNKVVDQVKKTALKSSKVLDQALKEIALCVSDVEVRGSNNGRLTLARYWFLER